MDLNHCNPVLIPFNCSILLRRIVLPTLFVYLVLFGNTVWKFGKSAFDKQPEDTVPLLQSSFIIVQAATFFVCVCCNIVPAMCRCDMC